METVWMKMLKPFGYHDDHQIGEVIPVDNPDDVDFFVDGDIAEIVDVEAIHHTQEDKEFIKYGVEKDVHVFARDHESTPIYLGTIYPKWKNNNGGNENE